MKSARKSRSISLTFPLVSLCMGLCSVASFAQSIDSADKPSGQSGRVTLTEQAALPSRPALVRRQDSFCSQQAWDNDCNPCSDVVQPSSPTLRSSAPQPDEDEVPVTGVDPVPGLEQIPDERVQSSSRVEEIPDERVPALPRIGE
jgi:hypothetical protein